jgi:hypothetical protein
MANTAALSASFDRARLDALGAWTADADAANLDINWAAPTDLADLAVPLKLRFHTDSGAESFDPDERMFELYERFVADKERYVEQVLALVGALDDVLGAMRRAVLVVYREGDEEDGDHYYALSVWFRMSGDDEHLYQADYDEDKDAFRMA